MPTDSKIQDTKNFSGEQSSSTIENLGNPGRFDEFPEKIEFAGVGDVSLKSAHIASLFVVASGLLITIFDFPQGLLLLAFFLLIVLGFEVFMIRRARTPVSITLLLREDPVQARQGTTDLGAIKSGEIDPEMESPEELGFKPDPIKGLLVWRFKSREDKEIVERRLLMYLPKNSGSENDP